MNPVHVHLALNHLPILGPLFGVAALAIAWLRRDMALAKWGFIVVLFSALATVPVYFSGEPAEERIEHMAGIEESFIEEHEESAEFAAILMGITGVLALAGLALLSKNPQQARWLVLACAISCAVTLAAMARTGNLGGQIRHEEIR